MQSIIIYVITFALFDRGIVFLPVHNYLTAQLYTQATIRYTQPPYCTRMHTLSVHACTAMWAACTVKLYGTCISTIK